MTEWQLGLKLMAMPPPEVTCSKTILQSLAEGKKSMWAIGRDVGATREAVAKEIKNLSAKGLIKSELCAEKTSRGKPRIKRTTLWGLV